MITRSCLVGSGGGQPRLRPTLLLATALLSLLAAAVASVSPAAAAPGDLDLDFSRDARYMTALSERTPAESERVRMAWAGRGRLYLASRTTVIRIGPEGRADRSFGRRGRIHVKTLEGTFFGMSGIAVDSRGRLLVAGRTVVPTGDGRAPNRWVTVLRYLPDGRLDPSFGNRGRLETTLGMAPVDEYLADRPTEDQHRMVLSVGAAAIAIDSADRPVLIGGYLHGSTLCYPFTAKSYVYRAFAARLTTEGALDPSFGDDGTVLGLVGVGNSLLTADDEIVVTAGGESTCSRGFEPGYVERRTASGLPDPGFGTGGTLQLEGYFYVSSMAADRDRGLALLGFTPEGETSVRRLRSDGSLRTSFDLSGSPLDGKGSRKRISYGVIEVEPSGRILLAGTVRLPGERRAFVLERRHANGALQRSFGDGGRSVSGFGVGNSFSADAMLRGGHGGLTIGGPVQSDKLTTGEGIAVIRYEGR